MQSFPSSGACPEGSEHVWLKQTQPLPGFFPHGCNGMALSNDQPAAPPSFPGGCQHLTRSLGGMSEFRKSLLMMAAFLLRKATSLSERMLWAAKASAESASLENLQKHACRSCSETSALLLGRHVPAGLRIYWGTKTTPRRCGTAERGGEPPAGSLQTANRLWSCHAAAWCPDPSLAQRC